MIKTNYHSHTKLCNHAVGMPMDYVKRAVECGYSELGISCHGPLLKEWIHRMTMDEFKNIYLESIDDAIKQYKDKIKIFKGLELEYIPKMHDHYELLLKDLDYLILGQHIILHNNGYYDIYKDMDDENVNKYKDQVIAGMRSGYFKILAHPDLFMFKYQTWNDLCEKVTKEIVEASIKYNVFLEINANGIRRKPIINQDGEQVYIYPRKEFWKVVSEYPEAKVIIGEDNHHYDYIDDNAVRKAEEFAKDLGIRLLKHIFIAPSYE